MVYRGPSRGCEACRRRRVKVRNHRRSVATNCAHSVQCDEVHPECGNCTRRNQKCPGYRNLFDALHRDETFIVSTNRSRKYAYPTENVIQNELQAESILPNWSHATGSFPFDDADTALPIFISPSRDLQQECLAYFISNFVDIPRDPSTNLFIQHLLPLYAKASVDGALAEAFLAVAINVAQICVAGSVDSADARRAYARAVMLLQKALRNPEHCSSDETLASILMLDFYDLVNEAFFGWGSVSPHLEGAIALLQERGWDTFQSDLSQRLFYAVWSRHINHCLVSGREVVLTPDVIPDETHTLPSTSLDFLNVELSKVQNLARGGCKAAQMTIGEFYYTVLIRALLLDQKLQEWCETLPVSWRPISIPILDVAPSILKAGVYRDLCEVYSSLEVSHTYNLARSSRIAALHLVSLSMIELTRLGIEVHPSLDQYLGRQTQDIVDRFCALIPFHLGDRLSLKPSSRRVEYPPLPLRLWRLVRYEDANGNVVDMTMKDHKRSAAAIGGWSIMLTLRRFLKAPIFHGSNNRSSPLLAKLRKGQLEWIRGQMKRLQMVYSLPDQSFNRTWALTLYRPRG